MSRHHPTISSLARRLRPTSEDFAAAAALHDPSLLLQLQATQPHTERSIRPAPPRHRRGDPSSIRRAPATESGGALLLVAAVALALLWWLTGPVPAGSAAMAASAAVYVALTMAAGDRAQRLRVFLLTLLVVDDVAALLVISFVYPARIDPSAVIVAAALLALLLSIRAIAARRFRARGDSSAAPLDQAKMGILATALLARAPAATAFAPLRRSDTAASVRRGSRLPATAPCPGR